MFTGLVSAVGEVVALDSGFAIRTPPGFLDGAVVGASICCAGCCLTATGILPDRFTVDISAETLSLTTLAAWRTGTAVNLERSLRMGDELGGHLVTGHVDATGELLELAPDTSSVRMRFALPPALAPFVARKGSVAVDGVSLTVNDAGDAHFSVAIIPHTAAVTTLGALRPGDRVNLEVDLLARYVVRARSLSA